MTQHGCNSTTVIYFLLYIYINIYFLIQLHQNTKESTLGLMSLKKTTVKHMFVWDNKCCSGISLKSCSNPSVHSWDSSCSQTSPGAQRRGRCSGCSSAVLCGSGISPGWSGDQSLPWSRISIAEGPSASDFVLFKSVWVSECECVSASTVEPVDVSAGSSLMRERHSGGKVGSFSALSEKRMNLSQVDWMSAGRRLGVRLWLNPAP